jgi:hypothetical protein
MLMSLILVLTEIFQTHGGVLPADIKARSSAQLCTSLRHDQSGTGLSSEPLGPCRTPKTWDRSGRGGAAASSGGSWSGAPLVVEAQSGSPRFDWVRAECAGLTSDCGLAGLGKDSYWSRQLERTAQVGTTRLNCVRVVASQLQGAASPTSRPRHTHISQLSSGPDTPAASHRFGIDRPVCPTYTSDTSPSRLERYRAPTASGARRSTLKESERQHPSRPPPPS